MIKLRNYLEEDAEETWLLFFKTIHTINILDYTSDQISDWATDNLDISVWKSRMRSINPFIAEIDGVIAEYTDL